VVVIVDSVRQQPSERGIVLRTEKTVGDDFEVDPPRLGTDGSLEVRWSPVTGADSYRVLFLSAKHPGSPSAAGNVRRLRDGSE
jgi:hypothetical protein